ARGGAERISASGAKPDRWRSAARRQANERSRNLRFFRIRLMPTISYLERRGELETYFDRTAVEAWSKLTSDAPVGRIRQTVRAGRDMMRETLMGWLPQDLTGSRILDAGCGTGALSIELAKRGADVLAIDLSPTLIDLARKRRLGETC